MKAISAASSEAAVGSSGSCIVRFDGEICSKPFEGYPGGKDAAGSAERIIGMFPPHSLYIEACLGGGAVLRRKSPALRTIGIDDDGRVIAAWRAVKWPGLELIEGNCVEWLEKAAAFIPMDALVYVDPPYPMATRSGKRLYKNEWSDADHVRLLKVLTNLPCSVVVSSYENDIYSSMLEGWQHESWQAMTRGGVRIEHAWCRRSSLARFGEPTRYVGQNFRERERIKRKAARWRAKLEGMPPRERAAVLAELLSMYSELESSELTRQALA